MDIIDTFVQDIDRACNAISYGGEVSDPLMLAAATVLMAGNPPAEYEHASNGRTHFACFVPVGGGK